MMDVACDQPTEIIGVFARSSTTSFVQQEFDAIDISKHSLRLRRGNILCESAGLDLFAFSFAVELGQLGNLVAIELGPGKT